MDQGVCLYLVGDEGILFCQATERLYRLNTTATFIWCAFEESLAPLEIACALVERFGVPAAVAERDVSRTLAEWKALGLLDPAEEATESRPHGAEGTVTVANVSRGRHPFTLAAHREREYALLNLSLRIRYPCRDTEASVHPVFEHLEARLHDAPEDRSSIFDIVKENDSYVVLKDGTLVRDRLDRIELAPIIQREALLAAYEATDCLVALHAAAVCASGRSVLLPGASGSGKSTFTAALMASGLTYLSDELSLLLREPRLVRAAPVSLSLKRDSWSILASMCGSLEHLSVHLKDGDVEVRYLRPAKMDLPHHANYLAKCVVFLRLNPGGTCSLSPLSTAEALCRIAESGYAMPGGLKPDRVEALLAWIEQVECYELRLGNLGEAVRLIKDLLA